MTLKTSSIRRARRGDANGVAEVHAEAWRYAYRGIIDGTQLDRMINRRGAAWWEAMINRRDGILVLEMRGKIAGYVTFGQSRLRDLAYRAEIYELYLLPEYHGLGFGRALFEAARATLQRNGYRSVAVRALADNVIAIGFYAAIGGVELDRRLEAVGRKVLPVVVFGWGKDAPRAA